MHILMKRAQAAVLAFLCPLFTAPTEAEDNMPQLDPRVRQASVSAEFPYPSKYVEVLGSNMRFIEKGNGQIFLFIHGQPASCYIWRNVIPYVSPVGRVIAVDMIGFGLSDKPEVDYTYDTHYRYIDAFISSLQLRNLILVGHNWGATIALDYARRHPDNAAGVVMIEPIIPPSYPREEFASELFRDFRDPEKGRKMLIEDNIFIEEVLPWGIVRKLSDEEMEAYRAPFRNASDRLPLYMWPNEIPVGGEPARNVVVLETLGNWMKTSDLPKLLQYASPGAIVTPETAQWMADNYRNLELQFVGHGIMSLQEDNPEAIGRGIAEWYRRLR